MYSDEESESDQVSVKNGISLSEAFAILTRRWRFVIVFGLVSAFCAAVISIFIPNEYTASTSTLPPANDSRSSGILSLAENTTGLEMLNLGADKNSPAIIYPRILGSRTLQEEILSNTYTYKEGNDNVSKNLYEYFEIENKDKACLALSNIMAIDYDKKTSMVTLTVTTEYPDLSAQIANFAMDRLDEFNKYKRKSGATLKHQFIATRLVETKNELAAAEEALKDFRDKNRNYLRTTDPDVIMEHDRLLREVAVKAQVYQMLAQELEMAAIQEKKEMPVVQILDTAAPPTLKSAPHRAKITLLGLIFGIICSAFLTLYNHQYPSGKNDERINRILRRIRLIRRAPEEITVEH